MKKISKILILTFILLLLSLSCVNASELNNVQANDAVDGNINENIILDSNYDDSLNSDLDSNLDANLNGDLNNDLKSNLVADEFSESDLEDDLDSYEDSIDDKLENDLVSIEDSVESDSDDNLNSINKNPLKDEATVHQVSSTTYSRYFDRNGYVITTAVSPGDTIDLSGNFNKKNFIFTIPCSITSSQNDAYLTNCMVKFENVSSPESSPSSVSNLVFNTSIELCSSVYLLGSSFVDVYNCNSYSTGANSNPTFLVGSCYCNIHDNVFETTFTGYMNMSWKRAGILLGESHYNHIYSNHVTVKDSNPIYLTTYGYEKSNYNVIFNNTVSTSAFSEETGLRNPSAWAYGVHIMGDHNQILNNTIMNTYRGVDSEGSYNVIVGNKIFNLSGSYYEGNDGTDGGEGGIFASYNNVIINNTIYDSKITGPAIYAVVNTTVCGNVVSNITGPNGIQFALSASNCLIENNTIDMNTGEGIFVKGNMTNLTISNNIISTRNGTAVLILKQTRAKFPIDVTLVNNCFLEYSNDYINYRDVEGKTIVNLENNTVVVVNDTFFRFFGTDGSFDSNNLFENFIFKGEFSDLAKEDELEKVSTINLNGKISIIGDNSYIKDISFNVNANNVLIDNLFLNITNACANTFNFNSVENCSLVNSIIHFNSTSPYEGVQNEFIPIFAGNSKITLNNNTILVYCDTYLMVLNNTNCSLSDNVFNSSSLSHVVILNDNDSCIFYDENEINSLLDPAIISINGAVVVYSYFIIDDSNYYDYFSPDGSFLEDVIFSFGDTFRIGNVNNKVFRFDIPLFIIGEKGSVMNNSTIILEGESSDSVICNFTFKASDKEFSKEFSFITIMDGLSNILIENNTFNANNLSSEKGSLSVIEMLASDYVFSDILIRNNSILIDSNVLYIDGISLLKDKFNEDLMIDNISIINNSINISNMGGLSRGINLSNSDKVSILDNSIYIVSAEAKGIFSENIHDLAIRDNNVSVYGLNFEKFLEYISSGDFDLNEFLENNSVSTDSAISIDNLINAIIEDNTLRENGDLTYLIHSSNPSEDIQFLIDNAESGDTICLGNNIYLISKTTNINKNILLNGGYLLSDFNDHGSKTFFHLDSDGITDENNLDSTGLDIDSLMISNMTVFMDNGNLFLLAIAHNDTNPMLIDVPEINLNNNTFINSNDKVVPESITILMLQSDRSILAINNEIRINENSLLAGMDPFKFEVSSFANGSGITVPSGGTLNKISTILDCEDMNTTAIDTSIDGRNGEYFKMVLKDENGNALANKSVQFGFNGKIYNKATDNYGLAELQINLKRADIYTFAVSFLGDDDYKGSFAVVKVTVKKQIPSLTAGSKTYKASAKTKSLTAILKTNKGNALANKKLTFTINGKAYTATTDSNGIATVNVSLSKKGTYSFTVKYAGDNTYVAVSKSSKLVLK